MASKEILTGSKVKKAWKLLVRTKKILQKKGIPFWVDSGTLLGFYREKRIFPHAKNMNISVPYTFLEKLFKLEPLFWPKHRFFIQYDITGRKWIAGKHSHIFVIPTIKTRADACSLKITPKEIGPTETRWIERRACKHADSAFFTTFESLTVNSVSFPIPGNTEAYLTCRYKNWQQVETNWNTNTDDGALLSDEQRNRLPVKSRWTRPKRYIWPIHMEGRTLKRAKRMIRDTIAILDKHNIRYWIDMGTLLGIIRDNELIPWDHDVDIAIDGSDAYKLLKIKGAFSPFYRIKPAEDHSGRLPKPLRSFRVKPLREKIGLLFGKKELHLDMYVKYKVDNDYYWIDSFTLKKIESKYYDTLDTIEWNGRTYAIPSDVETYLSKRYGDWRTPVRKFDSSLDDLAKAD